MVGDGWGDVSFTGLHGRGGDGAGPHQELRMTDLAQAPWADQLLLVEQRLNRDMITAINRIRWLN